MSFVSKIKRFWYRLFPYHFSLMREITFPAFQIVENPVIRLSEFKARRFYIIDRALISDRDWGGRPSMFHRLPYMRNEAEIMAEEDEKVFSAIKEVIT